MLSFLLLEVLPLTAASVAVILISYFKVPTNIQQGTSTVIMVLILVLFRQKVGINTSETMKTLIRTLLIFLTCLFVQLLVYSTGAFFSPFLILFHLFALGIGLLISFRTTVLFTSLSLIVLGVNIQQQEELLKLISGDIGSVILYITSFVVILPLTQILIKSYHLKEIVLKKLSEYAQITVSREQSLLKSINEYVVVTDSKLSIIFLNEAMEKSLQDELANLRGKQLFEVINLKDSHGEIADRSGLSIDNIVLDRTTRIIGGFYYYDKLKLKPIKVSIQIRPVTDPIGEISQLVFVLKDESAFVEKEIHKDLDRAKKRQENFFSHLKAVLNDKGLANLLPHLELLNKGYEDLFLSQELEDHTVIIKNDFQDIADLCLQVVEEEKNFAKGLGVELVFLLPPQETVESSILRLNNDSNINQEIVSPFSTITNVRWFTTMVKKLIELQLLIIGNSNSKIEISLVRDMTGKITISLRMSSNFTPDFERDKNDIFIQYYGKLAEKTNLKFGSGLEGFIAKSISTQLDIPLTISYEDISRTLEFLMIIDRKPKINP